jgi:S-adenosylmethionine:tRNA ribosyltransferase-isomerase
MTVCPETASPPASTHDTPAEPDGVVSAFAGLCHAPASAGPAQRRGLARDEVRLLVVGRRRLDHVRFRELGAFLEPGDLVVINTSATLPAAVDAMRSGRRQAVVHFSTELDDGSWVVELRLPDRSGPMLDGRPGELVRLGGGASLRLLEARDGRRLWRALPAVGGAVTAYLTRHGRPITYGYLRERHPLRDYQTVFATEPGSAEMPSAGRPFSEHLVTDLVTRGVVIAPVTLHTGVSSLEAHEPPQPERFRVPAPTARLVNQTRAAHGRVVAVGTTVTRALESAVTDGGTVEPREGWTDLVLGPRRPAKVVNGLITGWHEPGASHLLLLRAVAGETLVNRAYRAAADHGYLYHEFGDICLLLP